MKLYYDNVGTWVEVINIISFPIPQIRMDRTSSIIVEIRDFEGALYATWSGRDFTNMMVTDGAGTPTTLYRGFISGKKYRHNKLTIQISGFSKKLEGIPLNNNYVLEEGTVSEIPASIAGNESTIYAEAPDIQTNWDLSGDSHWNAVLDYSDHITLPENSTDVVDEFNIGTLAVNDISKIRVYLYGYRFGATGPPNAPSVDIYIGGAWQGYETVSIPGYTGSGPSGWAYAEFEGAWDSVDLDALKVRLKGTTGAVELIVVSKMYIKIFYGELGYDSLGLEDLSDPPQPFDWDADYWNSGFQDKGILITDSTKGTITKTWDASACAITGENTKDETFAKANTKNDELYVWANETEQPYNAIIDFDIDGTGVPTTHYLQKIEIDYQFGHWIDPNGVSNTRVKTELQIKKDADWIVLKTFWSRIWYPDPSIRRWTDIPTLIIENTHAELLKYFDTDNGNYDSLKGLRFVTTPEFDWEMGIVITEVDYISVRVYHNTLDIAPIMEKINDSEDHWITTTGIDWTDTGVYVGDNFKIGESTTQILTDIDIISGVTINIQSTLSKYIAQWFKGTYCIEVLKKICLLEGLHWWEDHQRYQIIVSKEADFVDSTVDLTQANYLWEWEFEGNSNQYKSVEVFGCAALKIYYKATDPDPTNVSHLIKTIIEETILTAPEAQEIADEQLLEYKVKRPSIGIPLNGVRALLGVGKTVTLTMDRPTVAVADYPIRMIQRHKIGISGIKTIIWCGLGKSTWEENLSDIINKAMYLAHRAHTDRLISTPPGEGAIITWGEIGGKDEGVRNIITTELSGGRSIDNAIDVLIADLVDAAGAVAAVLADDAYVKLVGDIMGGAINMNSNNITGVNTIVTLGVANYDKFRVWTNPAYTIGLMDAMTYGGLNNYAMTFTVYHTVDRGWVWRDDDDAKNDGAMSLTTTGVLTVKGASTFQSSLQVDGNISINIGSTVDGVDVSDHAANNDANIKHLTDAQLAALHAVQHAMDNATYHTSSDIATLNSSTTKHGFLKKLDNVATNFMNGQGNWSVPGVTEADVYTYLGINVANKRWINCIFGGENSATKNLDIFDAIRNVGATDPHWIMEIPLPYIIGIGAKTKNLVITKIRIGITDSDAGNYVDRIRMGAWNTASPPGYAGLVDIDHDTVHGTGVGKFEHNHADQTIGGTYERVALLIDAVTVTPAFLDIAYVKVEYYYT